jgi:aspartate kinase
MIVLKFGGKAIGTPEDLGRCLEIVEAQAKRKPVVVVSAHGGTTDELERIARRALAGEIRPSSIRDYHLDLASEFGVEEGVVDPLFMRLEALLHGIGLVKELTQRTMDNVLSFGERLSSRIVAAALTARGTRAAPVNAYDVGMITDSSFGCAKPLEGIEKDIRSKLEAMDCVPVVTGFIAKDRNGEITTLGRSGSDFTATFIASAVGAEEVEIWKSVDGVMTADPSLDERARNIPKLSFEEASELAYFGAEVLHPATLVPAISKGIPVRVANMLRRDDVGTVIVSKPVITDDLAKSIAYKEDVTLFHLQSPRLHSVPDVLSGALAILKECGIVAHMITTGEAGISLISQSGLGEDVAGKACEKLSGIAGVKCDRGMAIICVVGDELRGNPRSIGMIFQALAEAGVNARAITRSASEINVAFLVPQDDLKKAVRALHTLIVS